MNKQKFIELAKKYEQLSDELSLVREELNKEMLAVGLNEFAQDPETGIVYQVVKPTGTYISFREIDYIRTKKSDERAGSLSAVKAQAAGFTLK